MRRCLEHVQTRSHLRHLCLRPGLAGPPRSSLFRTPRPDFGDRCVGFRPRGRPRPQSQAWKSSKAREEHNEADIPRQRKRAHPSPRRWVARLDRILPRELSPPGPHVAHHGIHDHAAARCVLEILSEGLHDGTDVLAFMVLDQRRHKAVVHLVDLLLKSVAAAHGHTGADRLPSNVSWPLESLKKGLSEPVELDTALVDRSQTLSVVHLDEGRFGTADVEAAMQYIWPFLAQLIIASDRLALPDAKQVMDTALQILARIHNLGLVPPTVYNYALPRGTSTVQYPPILTMLTSRILSAMSDAVWRAYQDEAISQAIQSGKSLKEVSHDPPGGRFRLRVRELGPEIWVEFILWCCVEAGLPVAGAQIVNRLRDQGPHLWYAVPWSVNHDAGASHPLADWGNVDRHGKDNRGQEEGTEPDGSRDEARATPTASRIISAEVVLALTESLVNHLDGALLHRTMTVRSVQRYITDVVSFLEPHGLVPSYFDYLTVRFLQTKMIHRDDSPDVLREWASVMAGLRDLRTVHERVRPTPRLTYTSILAHSDLQAGILQQALQVQVKAGLVAKAVQTFTDLQKLVDASQLESLQDFLSANLDPRQGFFTGRHAQADAEFTDSHGHLPLYKIPPFLNLATDAELFGLGDWLLHSTDVDGPLVPRSAYSQPAMAIALTRYAAARKTPALIRSVLSSLEELGRKPSVTFWRTVVTSAIALLDWDLAVSALGQLRVAKGGGPDAPVMAAMAASTLRLESQALQEPESDAADHLPRAISLLADSLTGRFDPSESRFSIKQRRTFRQQIDFVLRVLEYLDLPGPVRDITVKHRHDVPRSNSALMDPSTFNVLFSAIVDTRGAIEGQRLWAILCDDPRPSSSRTAAAVPRASWAPSTVADAAKWGSASAAVLPTDNAGSLQEHRHRVLDLNDASEIPFADVERKDGQDQTALVVPNLRTLQILVKAALAERRALQRLSTATETALSRYDELLAWAVSHFRMFHLSAEDIEAELSIRPSRLDDLHVHVTGKRRDGWSHEPPGPNVAAQFAVSVSARSQGD